MPCKYGLSHVGLARCHDGRIYVAVAGGLCKIGCTYETVHSNVRQRLSAVRRKTGMDFELVHEFYFAGCIRGLEKAILKRYAEYRIGKDELFGQAPYISKDIARISSFAGTRIERLGTANYDATDDRLFHVGE